ncbi:MAG: hypothetical protein COA78_05580, partial [Blastopirellula sp.]
MVQFTHRFAGDVNDHRSAVDQIEEKIGSFDKTENQSLSKAVDLLAQMSDVNHNLQTKLGTAEETLLKGDIEYMIVHPEAVAEAAIKDGFMNIGYGSYHTLVMPQMEYIPLKVLEQLNLFEEAGGKILWVDDVPGAAEHAKNDEKV